MEPYVKLPAEPYIDSTWTESAAREKKEVRFASSVGSVRAQFWEYVYINTVGNQQHQRVR